MTNRGLWLPGGATRIGWHEIHKVAWAGRDLTVTAARTVAVYQIALSPGELAECCVRPGAVVPAEYAVMVDEPPVGLTIDLPGRLPEQVRQRVHSSIRYTGHTPLTECSGVRVVARRVSGLDGLRWTVRYDHGVDHARPEIVAATTDLVVRASQECDSPEPR